MVPGWNSFSARLTAADKATIQRRLAEIERIGLEIPELARPQGFEIMPVANLLADRDGRVAVVDVGVTENLLQSSYTLMMFNPSKAIAGWELCNELSGKCPQPSQPPPPHPPL